MSGGRDGIKVVLINTQYVETDAISFKSVVQKLTGKDSKVPDYADPFHNRPASRTDGGKVIRLSGSGLKVGPTDATGILSPCEFERLVKEMPAAEDLDYLWTD